MYQRQPGVLTRERLHLPAAGEDAESQVTDAPWRVLVWTFVAACAFTLASAWAPALRALPVFTWVGLPAATTWGWVLSPAMGYIGQVLVSCFNLCTVLNME